MKYLLFLLFFMGCYFQGNTQSKSRVILKNGSEITGIIFHQDSASIKLEIIGNNHLVFQKNEIAEIYKLSHFRPNRGFFFQIEPIIQFDPNTKIMLQGKMGYDFNRHWSMAFGSGNESILNNRFYPLFLEGKFNLFDHHITPYLAAQIGYLQQAHRKNNWDAHGFFTTASLNLICFTNEHIGISLGGGIRYNYLHRTITNNSGNKITYIDHQTLIEFRMGILFK